jgi:hypothetical protein
VFADELRSERLEGNAMTPAERRWLKGTLVMLRDERPGCWLAYLVTEHDVLPLDRIAATARSASRRHC